MDLGWQYVVFALGIMLIIAGASILDTHYTHLERMAGVCGK